MHGIEQKLHSSLYLLIRVLVLVSALKNIVYWRYPLLNSGEFFHFPVFSVFGYLPQSIFIIISLASFALACASLVFRDLKILGAALLINGIANLAFQLSDYIALHHDMYLSGVSFIILGFYLLSMKKKHVWYGALLGFATATYLVSGIYKINPIFLDGSMTEDIIRRSERFFYGKYFSYFASISVPLSYFAMIVEIVEPFILIFGGLMLKSLSILFTLPFHIGIILTGTGTVYNITYPALFWFALLMSADNEGVTPLSKIHLFLIYILIGICGVYLFYLAGFVFRYVGKYF